MKTINNNSSVYDLDLSIRAFNLIKRIKIIKTVEDFKSFEFSGIDRVTTELQNMQKQLQQ